MSAAPHQTTNHHSEHFDVTAQADDQLFDERRTAAFLSVAPKTLRQWRTRGGDMLPYVKLGGKLVRYRRADIEAFIRAGIRRSTSDEVVKRKAKPAT